MKHFELTGQSTTAPDGSVLYRVRALRDLPDQGVTAGDLGGYVASVDNLSGDAWVSGDAMVYGGARVCAGARVFGRAWVCGGALVSGNALVSGDAVVSGRVTQRDTDNDDDHNGEDLS